MFIRVQAGEAPIAALLDSGNLSQRDLIDHNAFMTCFPQQPQLKEPKDDIKGPGGLGTLDLLGSFETSIQLADYPQKWKGKLTVVKNLGTPLIFSAATMKKMPLVLDLGTSTAYVGPSSYRIPLQSSAEAKAPAKEVGDQLAQQLQTMTLKENRFEARLVTDVAIPPGQQVLAWVRADGEGDAQVFFVPCSQASKRAQLEPVPGLCHLRPGKKKRETPVLVQNPTLQRRRLRAGQLVGHFLTPPREEPQLHQVSMSRKKGPEPQYEHLDPERDEREVRERLFRFLGRPEATTAPEEARRRRHVKELFQGRIENNPELTSAEKRLVNDLLLRFYGILSKGKYDVGRTSLLEFEVETGDHAPVRDRLRPMNPAIRTDFQKSVREMLDGEIIALCNGQWASAVVPVRKPDGSWRYAVDYRQINKITKHDSTPVASPQEAMTNQLLREAKFYASADLTGAYLAVPVKESDQEKLAMVTSLGLYKFLRMPFGARNSGQTYARLMALTVGDLVRQGKILSFFDDHLVTGKTFLQTLFRLGEFFFEVERANLRISPKKTNLFTKKATWLGHEVTPDSLLPAEKLTKAVEEWPTPKSRKDVLTFLGKCSYYRKFLAGFAEMAEPLRKLLSKDADFEWTPRQEAAFQKLKEALCAKPVLAHPDFESQRPFILDCDASNVGIGAVLSQEQADGVEKPIAYFSKALTKAERNYSVTRKELLAIVSAAKNFKYFLIGRPFTIRTDHRALEWLTKSTTISTQLARWAEALKDFNFTINYRPGRSHANADALSRREEAPESTVADLSPEDLDMYRQLRVKPPSKVQKRDERRERKLGQQRKGGEEALLAAVQTRRQKRAAEAAAERTTEAAQNEGGRAMEAPPPQEETEGQEEEPTAAPPKEPVTKDEGGPECLCEEETGLEKSIRKLVERDELEGVEWEEMKETAQPAMPGTYDMAVEQERDPALRQVRRWKRAPDIKELSDPVLRTYATKWPHLELENDKLYLREKEKQRLCIPQHLIADVVRCLHNHPLAGHVGRTRCYLQARRSFYWPGMPEHISQFIAGCSPCARAKRRKVEPKMPLGQTSTSVGNRFERFFADIVGPWPQAGSDAEAKRYLLTCQCAVTKWPEAWPLSRVTAETVLHTIATQLLPRFGTGFTLVTDRGRQFTSALFRRAAAKLGVITATTQAYEPKSNPVERMHRTIEGHIRALMEAESAHPSQWHRFVPYALAAMRQNPLSNLPASPHYLVYGVEPGIPAQQLTRHKPERGEVMDIDRDMARLEKVLDEVRLRQLRNHEANKTHYDKRLRKEALKEGDWCWLHAGQDTSESGKSRKTAVFMDGPYRVTRLLNDRQVQLATRTRENKEGKTQTHYITVSRDRVTKASRFELSRIPAPLSWPTAKRYKVKLIPREYTRWEEEPRPTLRVEGMPFPALGGWPGPRPVAPPPPPPQQDAAVGPEGPPIDPGGALIRLPSWGSGMDTPRNSDDGPSPMMESFRHPYEREAEELPLPLSSEDEQMAEQLEGAMGGDVRLAEAPEETMGGDDARMSEAKKRPRNFSPLSDVSTETEAAGVRRPLQKKGRGEGFFKTVTTALTTSPPKPSDEGGTHYLMGNPTGKEKPKSQAGSQGPWPVLRYQRITNEAKPPVRRTPEAVGYDLAAIEEVKIGPWETARIGTGLRLLPPRGTYVRLASRSGLEVRRGLSVAAGVIDRDFRGEVTVVLRNHLRVPQTINKGDYIAQAILEKAAIVPTKEVKELPPTRRGDQGWGSTDQRPKERPSSSSTS